MESGSIPESVDRMPGRLGAGAATGNAWIGTVGASSSRGSCMKTTDGRGVPSLILGLRVRKLKGAASLWDRVTRM